MPPVARTSAALRKPARDTVGSSHRPTTGDLVAGRYRLVRLTGGTQTCSRWVATDSTREVPVVLEIFGGQPIHADAPDRLLAEARAAMALQHPNAIAVHDLGLTEHDEPFVVTELLTGETLTDLLERGRRLAPLFAVRLLLPIAGALSAAHARGIVHGDVKPPNIFLAQTSRGLVPKLTAFGVAKFEFCEAALDRDLDAPAIVFGSPDYLCPEQARGELDAGRWADAWALCVVLYECLTGRLPFRDINYRALLRHIAEGPIPPLLDQGVADAGLWKILARGFERQSSARWQSVLELGRALAGWLLAHGASDDVCGRPLAATWFEHQRPDEPVLHRAIDRLDDPFAAARRELEAEEQ